MSNLNNADIEKNIRHLHFIGAAYVDGYLWTNALEWNGYYKIDIENGKTEFLGLFEYADILADKLFYQVLAYEKYVFFIPWFSDYLVKLNTETLETKYWRLPESITPEIAKFRAAHIYKRKIIMFPMLGDIICTFDIEKEQFICDTKWTTGKSCKKIDGDFLQGYQVNDKLYLPTCLRNTVFKYEISNTSHEVVEFSEDEKGILSIEQYSEKELLVLTGKGNIWKYNIINGEKQLFYEYKGKTENPYAYIVRNRNTIYLFPAKEKNIVRLADGTEDVILYPLGWKTEYIDFLPLFGGYYKTEDSVWIYPIQGNMICQLDINSNLLKGYELYDDYLNREKEMGKFINAGYPVGPILYENKMYMNTFVGILQRKKKVKASFYKENGLKIWRVTTRR